MTPLTGFRNSYVESKPRLSLLVQPMQQLHHLITPSIRVSSDLLAAISHRQHASFSLRISRLPADSLWYRLPSELRRPILLDFLKSFAPNKDIGSFQPRGEWRHFCEGFVKFINVFSTEEVVTGCQDLDHFMSKSGLGHKLLFEPMKVMDYCTVFYRPLVAVIRRCTLLKLMAESYTQDREISFIVTYHDSHVGPWHAPTLRGVHHRLYTKISTRDDGSFGLIMQHLGGGFVKKQGKHIGQPDKADLGSLWVLRFPAYQHNTMGVNMSGLLGWFRAEEFCTSQSDDKPEGPSL